MNGGANQILDSLAPVFWKLLLLLFILALVRFLFEALLPAAFHKLMVRLRFRKGERWRTNRELISWLRSMKPSEFEEYIADLFNRMGFNAQAVGKSHDGGIDVEARKDGVVHYIQCKKFITSQVGVGDVRDFYGAIADKLSKGKGYFITTNKFTLEAEKYAEDKPIELIDGFRLVDYINKFGRSAEQDDDSATPHVCPKCGGTLVERTGKYGPFYGCSNFPRCKHTAQIN